MGIVISEVRIIVIIMQVKSVGVSLVNCWIAEAVPVLVLFVRKRVMNEVDMTRVLIEPRRIRNCFFESSEIEEAITAACEEPRPGKNEQIGEISAVRIVGLRICFFVIINLPSFCFGIWVF